MNKEPPENKVIASTSKPPIPRNMPTTMRKELDIAPAYVIVTNP